MSKTDNRFWINITLTILKMFYTIKTGLLLSRGITVVVCETMVCFVSFLLVKIE